MTSLLYNPKILEPIYHKNSIVKHNTGTSEPINYYNLLNTTHTTHTTHTHLQTKQNKTKAKNKNKFNKQTCQKEQQCKPMNQTKNKKKKLLLI
jgi:hypothetical protein